MDIYCSSIAVVFCVPLETMIRMVKPTPSSASPSATVMTVVRPGNILANQPLIRGPVNGNWEPFLRLSSENSNNIQLYYSRENAADDQDSLLRTSTDGGVTWSTASTISGEGITARDGMIGVANFPLGSNSLIAIFESQDTSPGGTNLFTLHSITSNDDGATWSHRNLVYAPTGSNTNAGAPQIIDIGGTLVVSTHSH